jgi:hypothetical protein
MDFIRKTAGGKTLSAHEGLATFYRVFKMLQQSRSPNTDSQQLAS